MMRLNVILAIILLSTCVLSRSISKTNSLWTDCCKSSDIIRIVSFDVSPNPLNRDSISHITIIGEIDEEINGGNVTMTFSYGYNIIVIKKTLDLCDLVEENGLNCPIRQDMISLGVQANIPATLPSGQYRGKIIVTNLIGNELMCIGLNLIVDI